MNPITLSTLNARYIHASLGLRYLFANMAELRDQTRVLEFTINERPEDILEQLLAGIEQQNDTDYPPPIFGFGVYIWNVNETTALVEQLKAVRPDCIIVVGGPEISHETGDQRISRLADHVILGQADIAFADLCREIIAGQPPQQLISALPFALDSLSSPYPWYTTDDLAHRVVYVEASRGCPFKCEFCLSSLDKTAVAFDLQEFLHQMELLLERGARQFKFVDRTFNLKAATGRAILEFFLEHIDLGLFLHFELIPDRLPDALKDLLPKFPAGSLQFEIGIQSFNQDVQQLISRKQHHEKTCNNLRWLRTHTEAHIHADLIFGLPGETLESFGRGFDELLALGPQEIQVGLLKRLRGTPLNRHTEQYAMRYMPHPPYRVLSTRHADFNTVQRMTRFSRFWDLIGNSGRFPNTLPLLLADQPFDRFLAFSDYVFARTGQSHAISLKRWFEYLRDGLGQFADTDPIAVDDALARDYSHNALKGQLPWMKPGSTAAGQVRSSSTPNSRQKRHLPQTSLESG